MPRGSNAFGQATANQAEWRRQHMVKDKFGRSWRVNVELETGHPIRSLPAGWSDPLCVPDKYISVGRDGFGGVEVDFDQWIRDQENALISSWWVTADGLGKAEMGQAYNPARARAIDAGKMECPIGDATQWVLDNAGDKPKPEPALVRLAKDGDRHLLGFEPMPCPLEDYMNWTRSDSTLEGDPEYIALVATKPSWPKFLGWHTTHGLSAQEASKRWNVLKEKVEAA